MTRLLVPYLSHYRPLSEQVSKRGPAEVVDGTIRVYEETPQGLLEQRFLPSFYLVRTPDPRAATGRVIPCTPEKCRRWEAAGIAYAAAVDDISAELRAVRNRAVEARWWMPGERRGTRAAWEEVLRRYPETIRVASEAYEPIRQEIKKALRLLDEKRKAEAAEQERKQAEIWRRRVRLAEREIWGWATIIGKDKRRVVYVFRYDVPRSDVPESVVADQPRVSLDNLRKALIELDWGRPDGPVWDRAALDEMTRELDGVTFEQWWRRYYHEDYRNGPFAHGRAHTTQGSNPSGGTATGGTGGFTGGFSVHGI